MTWSARLLAVRQRALVAAVTERWSRADARSMYVSPALLTSCDNKHDQARRPQLCDHWAAARQGWVADMTESPGCCGQTDHTDAVVKHFMHMAMRRQWHNGAVNAGHDDAGHKKVVSNAG